MIEWQLPPAPRMPWLDAPGREPKDDSPPDLRRDGLWTIEDEDVVWDAPLAGSCPQ